MVYLVQFVCLSDGVNFKVVAASVAEIDRPVYHDVRNSMPHPTCADLEVIMCIPWRSRRVVYCNLSRGDPVSQND